MQPPVALQNGIASAGKPGAGNTASQPSAIEVPAGSDGLPRPAKPDPPRSPWALRMQGDWCGFGAAETGLKDFSDTGPARPSAVARRPISASWTANLDHAPGNHSQGRPWQTSFNLSYGLKPISNR